jgi:glycosyltransferase EpsF
MNRGGAETLVMNIYRNIDRRRFQFDFAVSTFEPSDFDEEIKSLGGRIFPHPAPYEVGIRNYCAAFRRTLHIQGPFYVVHSHVLNFSGFVLRAAKIEGIPIRIAHCHSSSVPKIINLPRKLYQFWTRRLIIKYATILLGCSLHASKALYGEKIQFDTRYHLLKNSIDFENFFNINKIDSIKSRKNFGIPEDAIVIGHVGRFDKPKNHKFIIHVFRHVCSLRENTHLILIGDGQLRSSIKQIVENFNLGGRVHFFGVRDDIPFLMGMMDLVLFPSLYEGLPVVLVEAQAAGLPCVVSSSITNEIDAGLGLVDFIDLNSDQKFWVAAVEAALSKQAPNFEEKVRAFREGGFDLDLIVEQLERMYSID